MKKAEKTKQKIIDTYIALAPERNWNVSVKEICDRLDINRTTFYNYFKGTDDILSVAMSTIIKGDLSANYPSNVRSVQFRESIRSIAETALNSSSSISSLLDANNTGLSKDIYHNVIEKDIKKAFNLSDSVDDKLMTAFLSEGLTAALIRWIELGDKDPDTLVSFVIKATKGIMMDQELSEEYKNKLKEKQK